MVGSGLLGKKQTNKQTLIPQKENKKGEHQKSNLTQWLEKLISDNFLMAPWNFLWREMCFLNVFTFPYCFLTISTGTPLCNRKQLKNGVRYFNTLTEDGFSARHWMFAEATRIYIYFFHIKQHLHTKQHKTTNRTDYWYDFNSSKFIIHCSLK